MKALEDYVNKVEALNTNSSEAEVRTLCYEAYFMYDKLFENENPERELVDRYVSATRELYTVIESIKFQNGQSFLLHPLKNCIDYCDAFMAGGHHEWENIQLEDFREFLSRQRFISGNDQNRSIT